MIPLTAERQNFSALWKRKLNCVFKPIVASIASENISLYRMKYANRDKMNNRLKARRFHLTRRLIATWEKNLLVPSKVALWKRSSVRLFSKRFEFCLPYRLTDLLLDSTKIATVAHSNRKTRTTQADISVKKSQNYCLKAKPWMGTSFPNFPYVI